MKLLAGIDIGSLTGKIAVLKYQDDEIIDEFTSLRKVGYAPGNVAKNLVIEAKEYFGAKAEIITSSSAKQKDAKYESLIDAVLEMARRRPVSVPDICRILNRKQDEIENLLKGLHIKGKIQKREHLDEVYYTAEL